MPNYSVPAFNTFIKNLRTHFSKEYQETKHWEGVRRILQTLCADEAMRAKSREWIAKRGVELELHHDSDYKFFVGALIREPQHRANVHDHAHTWTIYGVLEGEEQTHVYERLDDGGTVGKAELKLVAKSAAPSGHVDIVPPWVPHSEWGMGERSVAITVRSQRPGGYAQNRFNLKTGETNNSHRGLKLIPTAV